MTSPPLYAMLPVRHRSARYIGSLVGDFHRTLLYGGIYGYPGGVLHGGCVAAASHVALGCVSRLC
jgi:acyl-coenzyme A thioesterase PaaI-like protein